MFDTVLEWIIFSIFFILAIIFGVLISSLGILRDENKSLKREILIIKEESQKEIKRVNDINLKAEDRINKSQKRINDLIHEKIPQDCKQAINWSIKQAKEFNNASI
jgi:hypothetical protein